MSRKTYYYTCPTCGANLDPGEICSECKQRREAEKDSEPVHGVTSTVVTMNEIHSGTTAKVNA